MKTDKESKSPPPYVSWKTLKNFLRSLVQGIPPQIDKSMMRSLSGGVQTQIIQALKAMHLIDDKGTPSSKMQMLVKAEGDEYKKLLREALIATYPFMRSGTLDPKTATMKMLEDEMGKLAGGGTVNKCIAFFVPAAKDAGIQLSSYIQSPGKRAPNSSKPKKARSKPKEREAPDGHDETRNTATSWHELLLSKFPAFDQEWPDEVKSKWFDNFAALRVAGEKKS